MNFSDRTYPAIVRDLLTVLTGGTVAEVHQIGADVPTTVPLGDPPVRRISHVQGKIPLGEDTVDYRFTERDFELVASDDAPDTLSAIRFRDHGKKPAPNTELVVNYYPERRKPTPLTDVNVGSVTRTLLETISRELATQYVQLQKVYESGFVETATGSSLDKVVALIDVRRLKRGHPVGKVRFSRRSGSPGAVFIPIDTAVSDGEGQRYFTSHEGVLQPNQSSVEVWVHGERARTGVLEAGKLSVLERVIAGVDRVSNDEPTWRANEDETDEQLAARARRASHGAAKGTREALRFGLEALPFVQAVALIEYPDARVAMPGTLRVDVALAEDNEHRRRQVRQRIDELRPAGIHVELAWAEQITLAYQVELRLAGATQPSSVLAEIQDGIRERLVELTRSLAPGGTLRRARLLSLCLGDDRVVDAGVTVTADDSAVSGDTYALPQGKTAMIDEVSGVTFTPPVFDEEPASDTFAVVQVDVDFEVASPSVPVSALESAMRPKLEQLLAAVQPGATITFQDLADAVRDDASFVLRPTNSVAAFDEEGGGFTEIRSAHPGWLMRPGLELRLRSVRVTEENA
ncbi:baseplate J/gp47 family protein [Haliangium sp.]|uniref:baseplate J/gp47 family protein n=1 Tax=Haliangium sp. TaxID=2663208 RepID=UPI003D0EB9E2